MNVFTQIKLLNCNDKFISSEKWLNNYMNVVLVFSVTLHILNPKGHLVFT